jgi:hypothetical protein
MKENAFSISTCGRGGLGTEATSLSLSVRLISKLSVSHLQVPNQSQAPSTVVGQTAFQRFTHILFLPVLTLLITILKQIFLQLIIETIHFQRSLVEVLTSRLTFFQLLGQFLIRGHCNCELSWK